MKSFIVDANVLLRFLTNDIVEQAERVEKRFKEAEKGGITLTILPICVIEVIFHLEHWYHYNRQDASHLVETLLSPDWLNVIDKDAVFEALRLYTNETIDFVDILLWVMAGKEKSSILSLDKDYDHLTPSRRIEP